MTGKPPEGAVASEDDFRVKRDEQGDLLPVWQPIPGTSVNCSNCGATGFVDADEDEDDVCESCNGAGEVPKHIQVIPLTQGEAQRYLPESGQPGEMSDTEIVTVINEFVVQPDFDLDVTRAEKELETFSAFGVEPLLMAIYSASGFDLSRGLVVENSEMLEAVEGNTGSGS